MSAALVPDQSIVSSNLTGVATAFGHLDEYYGLIAAVPLRSTVLDACGCMTGMDNLWPTMLRASWAWYGVYGMEAVCWRVAILKDLFSPFDPANADANCLGPLTALSQIERQIRGAGGTVTADQQQQVLSKLAGLVQWLTDQVNSITTGCAFLATAAVLQPIRDGLGQEARRLNGYLPGGMYAMELKDPLPDSVTAAIPQVIEMQNRIVAAGDAIQLSTDGLRESWATLQALTTSVAARIHAAQGLDVGSILQELDIDASLKEWPQLCTMAQALRPPPLPAIPAVPPGFEVLG